MAIDTSATMLVIGGGPIGLETALYARYLGYQVQICEAGDVGAHVEQWKHVRMFSPFSMNHSSLGKAAIESHHPDHPWPTGDRYLTGQQWLDLYLLPLSQTDLLQPHIQTHCRVTNVSRTWTLKTDLVGSKRSDDPFRIKVEQDGTQRILTADVVVDTSGVLAHPNPIGAGGVAAIGETASADHIQHTIPTAEQADQLAGQNVAVIGAGHSAACAIVTLVNTGVNVTWIVRGNPFNALQLIDDDPLVERSRILQELNELVNQSKISLLAHAAIDTVQSPGTPERPTIQLGIYHSSEQNSELDSNEESGNELEAVELSWHSFDHVFGLTGYRPDQSVCRELQVHQCYASEGPMKLAASLLGQDSQNCLDISSESRDLLITAEPNYYQLGMKSYGRQPGFLFKTGLQQIVQLFQILGDRESLDVYQTFAG